jgi:hypothetical protein
MASAVAELLKDSAYSLGQFKPTQIAALNAAITINESGKKPALHVMCLVRGKPIRLTPEEAIRQLYVMVLRDDLGYPVSRMQIEYEVTFGREKKRADICIFDKDIHVELLAITTPCPAEIGDFQPPGNCRSLPKCSLEEVVQDSVNKSGRDGPEDDLWNREAKPLRHRSPPSHEGH